MLLRFISQKEKCNDRGRVYLKEPENQAWFENSQKRKRPLVARFPLYEFFRLVLSFREDKFLNHQFWVIYKKEKAKEKLFNNQKVINKSQKILCKAMIKLSKINPQFGGI